MSKNFKVRVNDSLDFKISEEDIASLDAAESSGSSLHIIQDNNSFVSSVIRADFHKKTYSVKVNNTTYEVLISNQLDELIDEMGFSLGNSKQVNSLKAPMPGLILDLMAKAGQEVKENDPLLILEAMKMENTLLSPRDGTVKSVTVKKGNPVDKGQLLIEFE